MALHPPPALTSNPRKRRDRTRSPAQSSRGSPDPASSPRPPGGLGSSCGGFARKLQKTTLGWRQSAEKPEHLRRSLRTLGSRRLGQAGTPPARLARTPTGRGTRRSRDPSSDWTPALPAFSPSVHSPPTLPIGPATARPVRTGGRTRWSPATWGGSRSALRASHWLERSHVGSTRRGRSPRDCVVYVCGLCVCVVCVCLLSPQAHCSEGWRLWALHSRKWA